MFAHLVLSLRLLLTTRISFHKHRLSPKKNSQMVHFLGALSRLAMIYLGKVQLNQFYLGQNCNQIDRQVRFSYQAEIN